jgi:hypothetical protein
MIGGKDPNSNLWPVVSPHDNVPAQDASRFREFLPEKAFTEMNHPHYSPDLGPCEFWLFPELTEYPERTKIDLYS